MPGQKPRRQPRQRAEALSSPSRRTGGAARFKTADGPNVPSWAGVRLVGLELEMGRSFGSWISLAVTAAALVLTSCGSESAADPHCLTTLERVISEFTSDLIERESENVDYQYEFRCRAVDVDVDRLERTTADNEYRLPRGGGDHHRTFAVIGDELTETTPLER